MNTTNQTKLIRLYKSIVEYIDAHDQNRPSIREIADMMGTSTSVAKYNLNHLQELGWIKYTPKIERSIQPIKPLSELPEVPDLVVVDTKRECAVDGCHQPVWLGPRGMNFKLRMCETHERAAWAATGRRSSANKSQMKGELKILIVDHERDEIKRAV